MAWDNLHPASRNSRFIRFTTPPPWAPTRGRPTGIELRGCRTRAGCHRPGVRSSSLHGGVLCGRTGKSCMTVSPGWKYIHPHVGSSTSCETSSGCSSRNAILGSGLFASLLPQHRLSVFLPFTSRQVESALTVEVFFAPGVVLDAVILAVDYDLYMEDATTLRAVWARDQGGSCRRQNSGACSHASSPSSALRPRSISSSLLTLSSTNSFEWLITHRSASSVAVRRMRAIICL